jgi:uncharacterized membrane protein YfcA
MANVTFLKSLTNQSVDIVLAVLLLAGAVIGAQLGTIVGARLRGEFLRAALGIIVLAVCIRVAYDLFAMPADLFSLAATEGTMP